MTPAGDRRARNPDRHADDGGPDGHARDDRAPDGPAPDDRARDRLLRESWSANAAAWTAAIRGGRIESRRLATDAAVIDAVLAGEPESVLDVGCGEGWLARRLSGEGVTVTGIDASEDLIRRAREPATAGADFVVLDYASFAARPDQVGGPFDAVVCNFSLLGAEIRPLLAATRRVLKRNGRLVVQTVHPLTAPGGGAYADGWREEDFAAMGDGFRASMPWYFRTIGSWVEELAASGFSIERCDEPLHPDTGAPLSLVWIARPDAPPD